jgi:uncharacterized protein
MKYLVFSDSHGNIAPMRRIIKLNLNAGGLNGVFFLGDGIRDIIELTHEFPSLHFDCVLGNCDAPSDVASELTDTAYEKSVTVGAWKFLLMHGHKYDIKYTYQEAADHAIDRGVDCLFFGHSHRAEDIQLDGSLKGSVRMINPGSCGVGPQKSFALIETVNGQLVCSISEC